MPLEIERKFLVKDNSWKDGADKGRSLRQAYLADQGNAAIRVRIDNDEKAKLTIKSAQAGAVRKEFEYDIPVSEAMELMELAISSVIIKTRYEITYDAHTWEVDEFSGDNEGLVLAEIELDSVDENFTAPSWLGHEVTADKRYYNSSLSQSPFSDWKD